MVSQARREELARWEAKRQSQQRWRQKMQQRQIAKQQKKKLRKNPSTPSKTKSSVLASPLKRSFVTPSPKGDVDRRQDATSPQKRMRCKGSYVDLTTEVPTLIGDAMRAFARPEEEPSIVSLLTGDRDNPPKYRSLAAAVRQDPSADERQDPSEDEWTDDSSEDEPQGDDSEAAAAAAAARDLAEGLGPEADEEVLRGELQKLGPLPKEGGYWCKAGGSRYWCKAGSSTHSKAELYALLVQRRGLAVTGRRVLARLARKGTAEAKARENEVIDPDAPKGDTRKPPTPVAYTQRFIGLTLAYGRPLASGEEVATTLGDGESEQRVIDNEDSWLVVGDSSHGVPYAVVMPSAAMLEANLIGGCENPGRDDDSTRQELESLGFRAFLPVSLFAGRGQFSRKTFFRGGMTSGTPVCKFQGYD